MLKKQKIPVIFFTCCLLAYVITMYTVYVVYVKPKPITGEKTVSLVIQYSDNKVEFNDITTNVDTLHQLIQQVSDSISPLDYITQNSSFDAVEIVSLLGCKRNTENQIYYMIYVNNSEHWFSVDQTILENGNSYQIKLEDTSNWPNNTLAPYVINSAKTDKNRPLIIALITVSIIVASAVAVFIVLYNVKKNKKSI